MLLRTLKILALEAKTGPEIFNRCRWPRCCFLPGIERSLQSVEIVGLQLRLRESIPCLGIIRSDGDDAPAQFNDCRLIVPVLSCFELGPQLLKLRWFCCG